MLHLDPTMSFEVFALAVCLFISANVLMTLENYSRTRTLSKRPFPWFTSYFYQGLIIATLLLYFISCWDGAAQALYIPLVITRGIMLLGFAFIAQIITKITLCCREMYVRWHIFGNP